MNNMFQKTWHVFIMTCDCIVFYIYWFYRDMKYGMLNRGKEDLLNRLLVAGHIIEKGITMPNRKYGFGKDVIQLVVSFCYRCIKQYGVDYDELQYAIDDLREYKKIHEDNGVDLPEYIVKDIDALLIHQQSSIETCREYTKEEFFKPCIDFKNLACNRHTSRYYNGEAVPNDTIIKAVDLAKTAPSACNRQSVGIKVVSGEKKDQVVALQNGNRGFGEKIGQMIIITAEQIAWDYNFRTSAYLDGGIFVMNLLYALHYYGVCACTLNAHLSICKQKKLRKIANIKDSEIIVAFIAIGMPTDKMMIAKSTRKQTKNILEFV